MYDWVGHTRTLYVQTVNSCYLLLTHGYGSLFRQETCHVYRLCKFHSYILLMI